MPWNPNVPNVINRVQDDLAAMRENFQHLDPLAQAVDELRIVSGLAPVANELQAVSGLAPVANELQAVSGLAPYIQALLDSRIVDHNLDVPNPPNGWYVRWENGLQVCCVGPVNTTFSNASNLVYVWTYPATFASIPRVYATGYYQAFSEKFRQTTHIVYSRDVGPSTAHIGFGSHAAWENGDQSLGDQIMGYAIGRWK